MTTYTQRIGTRTLALLGLMCVTACASTGPAGAQTPAAVPTQASPTCTLEGVWQPPEARGGGLVQITEANSVWTGQVMIDGQPAHQILKELRYDAEDEVYEGKLDAPDGPEVSAKVVCISENEIEVTGRRMGMSRSFRWLRYDPPGGSP